MKKQAADWDEKDRGWCLNLLLFWAVDLDYNAWVKQPRNKLALSMVEGLRG